MLFTSSNPVVNLVIIISLFLNALVISQDIVADSSLVCSILHEAVGEEGEENTGVNEVSSAFSPSVPVSVNVYLSFSKFQSVLPETVNELQYMNVKIMERVNISILIFLFENPQIFSRDISFLLKISF